MSAFVVLIALALAAPAHPVDTEVQGSMHHNIHQHDQRSSRILGHLELPRGCMYEGRWFTEGTSVTTREACLSCACARGALSCRRRACAALPDPPPRRCHVLHKKGSCCPELHCPDGIKIMEHGASARFENDDFSDIATPASIIHACVEGGTVYSAGSAMGSSVACEQCFCLGGARRCVRPRCLPPPPGCRARPAPGACCPQRYYCDHFSTKPPEHKHIHDCEVNGELIAEGERVTSAERVGNCTQCFCLHGAVRCQPLACAPPLLGCQPLLRPGQCCPHQYHCDHKPNVLSKITPISENSLYYTRYEDRALHSEKQIEAETTTKVTSTSPSSSKNTVPIASTKTQSIQKSTHSTTKVKRKTSDPPSSSSSKHPVKNTASTMPTTRTFNLSTTTKKLEEMTTGIPTTETVETVSTTTEQPEGSVKIMINGTINCTAELSSTSIPLNMSLNDTEKIKSESHLRTPIIKMDIEAYTEYPNDIITDRSVNGYFDENETFTINVTSSLIANNSHSTPRPSLSTSSVVTSKPSDVVNSSKKTKGDYDYDYTEPTLPPSLPNLKIIPFVAADAVVEDDDITSKEESPTYPMLEREDKFPVYYSSVDTKDIPYVTRREDSIQYPVFTSEKEELPKYPNLSQDLDLPNLTYPTAQNDLDIQHDYSLPTVIGSNAVEIKDVTKLPTSSSTFGIETPAINLFSPPVETEGGFVPKGPGLIEEYYAVYPSTPPGPQMPHLTTSMQLDVTKGECISSDGRHVLEGDSISLACSICTCGWGDLHCSPRPCHVPQGCTRRPATSSSVDLCCGELICDQNNITTMEPNLLIDIKNNESIIHTHNQTKTITSREDEYISSSHAISNDLHTTKITNETSVINEHSENSTTVSTNSSKLTTPAEKLLSVASPTIAPKITSTEATAVDKEYNYTKSESQEYEDEEDEDEGFSFGSVLKLLLSDNYESTPTPPFKKLSTYPPKPSTTTVRITTPTPTTKRPSKPPLFSFVPMPLPYLPLPPKKSFTQNTVNRIDHLVLGEATAIKKTTPRPISTQFRPVVSYTPVTTRKTTTQRPYVSTRYIETTKKPQETTHAPIVHEVPRPSSSALPLPGILKLAGCNIYGRMYRVGRIITELSTPCQECWCTELGVQCNSLKC